MFSPIDHNSLINVVLLSHSLSSTLDLLPTKILNSLLADVLNGLSLNEFFHNASKILMVLCLEIIG